MAFRPRDQECVCDVYPQTERDVSEVAALKYELAVQEPVEARLARAKASEARQMEAREAREAH